MARNAEAHGAFYSARNHVDEYHSTEAQDIDEHPLMTSLRDPSMHEAHEVVRGMDAEAGGTRHSTMGPTNLTPGKKYLPKGAKPRKLYRPGMKMAWDD